MAVMPTGRFLGPEFRAALEGQIERVRASREHLRTRSARDSA
jgi:hypothetical protein